MSDSVRWDVWDEVKFIEGIGGHRVTFGRQPLTPVAKMKALEGYVESFKYPSRWTPTEDLLLLKTASAELTKVRRLVGREALPPLIE